MKRLISFFWIITSVSTLIFTVPSAQAKGEWEGAGIAVGAITFLDIMRDGRLDWPGSVFGGLFRHGHGCRSYGRRSYYGHGSPRYWEGFYNEKSRMERRRIYRHYRQGRRDARRYYGYDYYGW